MAYKENWVAEASSYFDKMSQIESLNKTRLKECECKMTFSIRRPPLGKDCSTFIQQQLLDMNPTLKKKMFQDSHTNQVKKKEGDMNFLILLNGSYSYISSISHNKHWYKRFTVYLPFFNNIYRQKNAN